MYQVVVSVYRQDSDEPLAEHIVLETEDEDEAVDEFEDLAQADWDDCLAAADGPAGDGNDESDEDEP